MKDVLATLSKILFYVLAAAVITWTASLTISLVQMLLPGDDLIPFFALALFDGGALVWALAFLFHSQGLPQRAIALLAMTIDLVGVIGVSIAALFLSGQELAAIPQGMGSLVVWCVGIWTAINLIAIYAYHLADPSEMTEIRLRSLQDRIQSEALDQVESQVRDEAAGLAGEIAHELRADVLARLRLTGRDFPQLPARDEAAEVGSDPLSSKPPKAR